MSPKISIVVEAKNQAHEAEDIPCLDGLARQTHPLAEVEIIAAGDRRQVAAFRDRADRLPFLAVRSVEVADEDHTYFGLKHAGASLAVGEILIFLDWDVVPGPGWLAAAVRQIEAGASVANGPAVFRGWRGFTSESPWILAASSVTWSRVFFEANNAAFRTEVYRRFPYRPEDGRLGWIGQFEALRAAGLTLSRSPDQRVLHYFTPTWWLFDFNFRAGVETVRLHWRLSGDPERLTWRQRLIVNAGLLAPPMNMFWGVAGETPRWLRYSRLLGLGAGRRALGIPLVIAVSTAAHACQVAGMYATLLAPERMIAFSDSR
jgi:hypothetical protein